jgi:hypothetical protein
VVDVVGVLEDPGRDGGREFMVLGGESSDRGDNRDVVAGVGGVEHVAMGMCGDGVHMDLVIMDVGVDVVIARSRVRSDIARSGEAGRHGLEVVAEAGRVGDLEPVNSSTEDSSTGIGANQVDAVAEVGVEVEVASEDSAIPGELFAYLYDFVEEENHVVGVHGGVDVVVDEEDALGFGGHGEVVEAPGENLDVGVDGVGGLELVLNDNDGAT